MVTIDFGVSEIDIFGEKLVGLHGHQATFDSITKIVHTVGYIPKQINMGHLHQMHTKDLAELESYVIHHFVGWHFTQVINYYMQTSSIIRSF